MGDNLTSSSKASSVYQLLHLLYYLKHLLKLYSNKKLMKSPLTECSDEGLALSLTATIRRSGLVDKASDHRTDTQTTMLWCPWGERKVFIVTVGGTWSAGMWRVLCASINTHRYRRPSVGAQLVSTLINRQLLWRDASCTHTDKNTSWGTAPSH